MKDFSKLKVAVVHYWFVTWRGGEKVVESILKLFPQADVYTLFYDEEVCGPYIGSHRVFASKLNIPLLKKRYQKLFPLFPKGIKSLKLQDEYDLIISSESGPAKGISIKNRTPHLCYIHTPMRYCWGYTQEYLNTMPMGFRGLARFFFNKLRKWDKTTIDNVDHYVANSDNVKKRVNKYYNRNASVVYPPIALELYDNTPLIDRTTNSGEHYLSFGAITPYKRIDLLVDAFNKNGKKLIVIGNGSEKERLQKIAKDNIQFTGSLPWEEIQRLILCSKALLFPGEEDFGMIPLEVMAYGLPVIAFGKGGALETVVENIDNPKHSSGLFFQEQTVESLEQVIAKFELMEEQFNPQWIRAHSRTFGEDIFQERIKAEIVSLLESFER